MLYKNLTDHEIIHLLKEEGNLRHFSLIVEKYESQILSRCKSYVRDKDIAEDLCQEILIKVFLKIKSFKGESRFSTWLFAIVHNTCVDYLRKNKKSELYKIITEKMADEMADLLDDVDEVSEEISIQTMEMLLEEMSPDEKVLLLLKYKEKHSIKDIHLSLNLSESAVKMRLKRAKHKANKLYHKILNDRKNKPTK